MKPNENFHPEDRLDRAALQAVAEGDRNAFREIVDRYTSVIYNLAYRMLGDSRLAEEAVQEIFLRVYRSLHRFDGNRRFFTWMFTLAVNHLRSSLRSRRWRRDNTLLSFDDSIREQSFDDKNPDPEADLIKKEAIRAVHGALQILPVKYREVFVLREIEEIPLKDTAMILGVPENTVKTWTRRSREKLKKILAERDWE